MIFVVFMPLKKINKYCCIKLGETWVQLFGYRLGGGIYSDTNVGEYCGMKVAVTRITLNIHENQMSQETLNWMKEEIWGLR